MRSLYAMPTVKQYAERRAATVKDAASRRFFGGEGFSYFKGPKSYYPEAQVDISPEVWYIHKTRRHAPELSSVERREQRKVLQGFAREYGKGVKQKTVREKSKEMTRALPLAVTWTARLGEAPKEVDLNEDVEQAALIQAGGISVEAVRPLYREKEVVAMLAPRKEKDTYWIAILLVSW
jgi:lysyl-tRNA synthetase class I